MTQESQKWPAVLRDNRELYIRMAAETDSRIGSFLSFSPAKSAPPGDGALDGMPVGIKDNIAVKDRPLTCGSKILEDFTAPYTATAVQKLEQAGAVIAGKTSMDEFGMGSSNEHSAFGPVRNPWDTERVPGGSSGGSAAAVAAGLVPLALGSDTGGSVRQPANFCGVYGLKPTYGSVSRYGLTAYASSLEVIGAMSRDPDLLETAFTLMSGPDPHDQSSVSLQSVPKSKGRICVLETEQGVLDDAVAQACSETARVLRDAGHTVEKISLDFLNLVVPAYYTIAAAEASANLARYNGIRYGLSDDMAENPAGLMKTARSQGFGDEVKLRILLGTYVLRSGFQDQYYGQAQKIRSLIRGKMAKLFDSYDALLMPVFPTQAFLLGDPGMDDYRQRTADVYTCLANLAGLPALSVPAGLRGGLPSGVQFTGPPFAEARLFDLARTLAPHWPVDTPPVFLGPGSLA